MNPAWLAPPTAILVGLGIVMVIVGVTSRISGWSLLAEAYPCLDEVEGRRRWFASMGLRRWSFLPANYGGIVVLTFMPEGVRFWYYQWLTYNTSQTPMIKPYLQEAAARGQGRTFGSLEELAAVHSVA